MTKVRRESSGDIDAGAGKTPQADSGSHPRHRPIDLPEHCFRWLAAGFEYLQGKRRIPHRTRDKKGVIEELRSRSPSVYMSLLNGLSEEEVSQFNESLNSLQGLKDREAGKL